MNTTIPEHKYALLLRLGATLPQLEEYRNEFILSMNLLRELLTTKGLFALQKEDYIFTSTLIYFLEVPAEEVVNMIEKDTLVSEIEKALSSNALKEAVAIWRIKKTSDAQIPQWFLPLLPLTEIYGIDFCCDNTVFDDVFILVAAQLGEDKACAIINEVYGAGVMLLTVFDYKVKDVIDLIINDKIPEVITKLHNDGGIINAINAVAAKQVLH
jgi:hypothetical protein